VLSVAISVQNITPLAAWKMVHAILPAAARSRSAAINIHSRASGGGGRRGNRIYPSTTFVANPSYRNPYDFGPPSDPAFRGGRRLSSSRIHLMNSAKSLKRSQQRLQRKDSGSSVGRPASTSSSTSRAKKRRSSSVVGFIRGLATALNKPLGDAGPGNGAAGAAVPSPSTGPRHPPLEASEPSTPIDRPLIARTSSWEERQAQAEEMRAQTRQENLSAWQRQVVRASGHAMSSKPTVGAAAARATSNTLSEMATSGGDSGAPHSFICSITGEVMKDPVISMDGHTYERVAIDTWFDSQTNRRSGFTSPKTNAPLPNRTLLPNYALREAIEEWALKSAAVVHPKAT